MGLGTGYRLIWRLILGSSKAGKVSVVRTGVNGVWNKKKDIMKDYASNKTTCICCCFTSNGEMLNKSSMVCFEELFLIDKPPQIRASSISLPVNHQSDITIHSMYCVRLNSQQQQRC